MLVYLEQVPARRYALGILLSLLVLSIRGAPVAPDEPVLSARGNKHSSHRAAATSTRAAGRSSHPRSSTNTDLEQHGPMSPSHKLFPLAVTGIVLGFTIVVVGLIVLGRFVYLQKRRPSRADMMKKQGTLATLGRVNSKDSDATIRGDEAKWKAGLERMDSVNTFSRASTFSSTSVMRGTRDRYTGGQKPPTIPLRGEEYCDRMMRQNEASVTQGAPGWDIRRSANEEAEEDVSFDVPHAGSNAPQDTQFVRGP